MHARSALIFLFVCMSVEVLTQQQSNHVSEFKGYMNAWIIKFGLDENSADYNEIVHIIASK